MGAGSRPAAFPTAGPAAAAAAGPAPAEPAPAGPAPAEAAAAPAAADVPAATAGRGVRRVNLAITMPIPAHNAASAISCVPISRRSSGPTFATCAGAPRPAVGSADGLGVPAGIEGRSGPMLPPVVEVTPPGTSGSVVPDRPPAVVTGSGVDPAELGAGVGVGVATTVVVTAAEALTDACGLVAVIFAVSLICSPLVLELGTTTAAWSSNSWPLASVASLHVLVCPLGHTAKWGVAAVGVVVRVTVTPVESAPTDDSQMAKFAVPPGFTFELPAKTSTLSHNLTDVGAVAKTAAT